MKEAKMRRISVYLLSGLYFLLVMEFMFQIQIGNDLGGFLFTPIIQVPFLLFAYFTSDKIIDRFGNPNVKESIIYIFYGLIGLLLLEWLLIGNNPWGNPDAFQFAMFTYWGGAVVFARIITEYRKGFRKVKMWTCGYFIVFSSISISIGFMIPEDERSGWIILMGVIGYCLMNVFFIWYFVINYGGEENNK